MTTEMSGGKVVGVEEWVVLIREVEGKVQEVVREGRTYEVPSSGVAGTIDHTLLKLDATEEQVTMLCEEARREGFAVCLWL